MISGQKKQNTIFPKRIQRRRVKGWVMPLNTIYVGRGSKYGNPYKINDYIFCTLFGKIINQNNQNNRNCTVKIDRKLSVELYRATLEHLIKTNTINETELAKLRGKNLACWCPLRDKDGNKVPCHADVLLELANKGKD